MKRFVTGIICVCIVLFCLTGCSMNKPKNVENKLDVELRYVEDLIFKIAIKHAKGEYWEEEQIKWEYIKGDIEKINNSWATLILDLTEVKASNQDIIDFGNDLNNLMISVSTEDENIMFEKLDSMYNKIIKFKESYSKNKNQIEKNKIKGQVLSVYGLVNKNDYEGAKNKSNVVVENYKGLMNDESYAEENSYNLNKIYILLEELNKSINTENYDLIRMKYILAVENL